MDNTPGTTAWSFRKRMGFRFIFAYFSLYIFPFPVSLLLGGLIHAYRRLASPLISWAGTTILGFGEEIVYERNGSGDTSFHYVQMFVLLCIAVVAAIVWSVVDRKRKEYDSLLYVLKIGLRTYLAYYLIVYGTGKLPGGQFPHPDAYRLLQPYGESSPMGLAWTFLGYSTAFGLFMGFFETLGGVLLLFRRTVLLGACVAASVTSVIVMVNYCFDVPVKLFSSHLLLMEIFLIVCERQRLMSFFLLNEATPQPASPPAFFVKESWLIPSIILKGLFGMVIVTTTLSSTYRRYKRQKYNRFNYFCKVEQFVRNGQEVPPLTTDSTRWDWFYVNGNHGYAVLRMMNKKRQVVQFYSDTDSRAVMYPEDDSSVKYKLLYVRQDSLLTLSGVYLGDSLFVKMKTRQPGDFLLMKRGFHWINEYPYNR